MQNKIRKLFQQNETYIFLIIFALTILIQARSGQFYTPNNIVDIMSAMIVPDCLLLDISCNFVRRN